MSSFIKMNEINSPRYLERSHCSCPYCWFGVFKTYGQPSGFAANGMYFVLSINTHTHVRWHDAGLEIVVVVMIHTERQDA